MSDKVPDWAKAEANRLVPGTVSAYRADQRSAYVSMVASALLSAYGRGVEDSAAKADNVAANPPGTWFVRVGEDKAYECGAMDSATAIRRLGEAE